MRKMLAWSVLVVTLPFTLFCAAIYYLLIVMVVVPCLFVGVIEWSWNVVRGIDDPKALFNQLKNHE